MQVALTLVWRVPHATDLGGAIALPLVIALVYAFVSADAAETPVAEALIWERFLERAWAVIVIDFALGYVSERVFVFDTSTNPIDLIVGFAALIVSAFTLFADAAAVVDDDVTVWTVIPRAILRSVISTWNRTVFIRALAIFLMELLVVDAQRVLYLELLQLGVSQALFWALVPIATVITPPLAALTVVVYRDAAGVLR